MAQDVGLRAANPLKTGSGLLHAVRLQRLATGHQDLRGPEALGPSPPPPCLEWVVISRASRLFSNLGLKRVPFFA